MSSPSNTTIADSTDSTASTTYTVHIHSGEKNMHFQSDVLSSKTDALELIDYMTKDGSDSFRYTVYENNPLHNTTVDNSLSNMRIESYEGGYLLIPQSDDPRRGKERFYNAWWMHKVGAWIFVFEHLDKFIDMGAVYNPHPDG